MNRIIVRTIGRICSVPSNFVSPTTAKLRAAITTAEVASVIKVDFHITGDGIL
jgi:hypothetical protein